MKSDLNCCEVCSIGLPNYYNEPALIYYPCDEGEVFICSDCLQWSIFYVNRRWNELEKTGAIKPEKKESKVRE